MNYTIIAPVSISGKTPDDLSALPKLNKEGHGTLMGVGGSSTHLVYRFNFDDRSNDGKWSYLYMKY